MAESGLCSREALASQGQGFLRLVLGVGLGRYEIRVTVKGKLPFFTQAQGGGGKGFHFLHAQRGGFVPVGQKVPAYIVNFGRLHTTEAKQGFKA